MGRKTQFPVLWVTVSPTWPRRPYNGQLKQKGLGVLRQGLELSSLYPTFLPRMWEQEREPQKQPHPTPLPYERETAYWVSWVESQPFGGGRASWAFDLRESCQPASSSLNPILRKPSLSCLPLPPEVDLLSPQNA